MKVLVMGAGVVGVTTAWYLAKAGHEVVVVDRRTGAGLETSFANGGQVSPCHSEPWANPATPKKIVQWLGHEDAPLILRWQRWDPAMWRWGLRFLANCTSARARINTDRTLRVAIYSLACLQALRAETQIDYLQKTLGILHIFRDPAQYEHAVGAAGLMQQLGLPREVKSPAEAEAIEPALAAVRPQLAGAIYTPGDESGDAHLFAQRLAELCAKQGVSFVWDARILGLELEGGKLASIATTTGRLRADAFVMALASWSPLLAQQIGLRLPIYPAKGYSATLAVTDEKRAPNVSITDDERKMVFSRLGDKLRCAGTAELAGWNDRLVPTRAQALVHHAEEVFPGAGDYPAAELWAGLRAVTPDSVPVLGRSPLPNLFLNTGHGTLGWTMACGAGRAVADLISGRDPDIDMNGLGFERFRGWL